MGRDTTADEDKRVVAPSCCPPCGVVIGDCFAKSWCDLTLTIVASRAIKNAAACAQAMALNSLPNFPPSF